MAPVHQGLIYRLGKFDREPWPSDRLDAPVTCSLLYLFRRVIIIHLFKHSQQG